MQKVDVVEMVSFIVDAKGTNDAGEEQFALRLKYVSNGESAWTGELVGNRASFEDLKNGLAAKLERVPQMLAGNPGAQAGEPGAHAGN